MQSYYIYEIIFLKYVFYTKYLHISCMLPFRRRCLVFIIKIIIIIHIIAVFGIKIIIYITAIFIIQIVIGISYSIIVSAFYNISLF